jgi:hypothetical protein
MRCASANELLLVHPVHLIGLPRCAVSNFGPNEDEFDDDPDEMFNLY